MTKATFLWRKIAALLLTAVLANVDQTEAQAPRTAEQDHLDMMSQLGIRILRPGPSGSASAPNHANYDESLANPFPVLPELLRLKNAQW